MSILPLTPDDFALFQELLNEASGLHFEEARSQFLETALWERVQHRGYDSYREYYHFLKYHPEGRLEMRDLFDLITVGETFFFRNKAQYDVLMKEVFPEILRRKASSRDRRIRAWSAGCSGGDEAYSIAIAFMEAVPSHEEWSISILGTDINRKNLACAEEAVYGERNIAYLPKEYVDKYFNVRGTSYVLNPKVRQTARFEYHNLARDWFLHEAMQQIDLLFCRNVTIYFDPRTTQRVVEAFHHCLSPEGYLFLGHTETLWQIAHKFERVEFPQTFIYRKGLRPDRAEEMMPRTAIPEMGIEDAISNGNGDARRELGSKKSEPRPEGRPEDLGQVGISSDVGLPQLRPVLLPPEDSLHGDLMKAAALVNEAKYEEAAALLGKIIAMDNLSAEAYYLLGALRYKNSRLKDAEDHFRKVIYICPDTVLAYFNLGTLYSCQGKYGEAAREFRNAIRLLEEKPEQEQVRFCEEVTAGFLLRACRNNLVEISKRRDRYA
jgi:chemotaxis protein methyltransferase CheR